MVGRNLAGILVGAAALTAFNPMSPPANALSSGDTLIAHASEPWLGDLDDMRKAGVIRVLLPYSYTGFYLLEGQGKGWVYEYAREFEKYLNGDTKDEKSKIELLLIPTRRDQLIAGLLDGHGDIVATDLTITPARLESIDFSVPIYDEVMELIVTHSKFPDISSPADLAGMEIHVRKSSSYQESLEAVNLTLEKSGLAPISIIAIDEALEDEDALEMVDQGLIPAIVMDRHAVNLWSKLYKEIKIHTEFPIRENAQIAWAFRKNSPQLEEALNGFISQSKVGTTLGNILAKRYYSDVNALINPKTQRYRKKLEELRALFEKTGNAYDIDPLLLAAQAFQESRFDQNAKSRAGAVGIMQILPSTAKDKNVAIKNYTSLDGNVEAGAKYLRYLADRYFTDPEITELDRIFLAFAAYNAGPARIAAAREKAADPNIWFDNVEWEVARSAGTEPIRYVKNIYIYYLVFKKFEVRDREIGETSPTK